jgi:DNA-binding response OmpR family regulator
LRPRLEREGHDVTLAANASEANVQTLRTPSEAIILALLLRPEAGLVLLQHWRREGLDTHILTILSGEQVCDRVRCLDLGADGYLTMPLHVEELLARLRYLARRREKGASVLKIYDLEINRRDCTVRRGGRPIRLTTREFDLLELLALHRGKVVTRRMMWDQFYDQYDVNTSNVIDVYIRYLRNKIDKGFEPPLILTRWGEGYLMRDEHA